MKKLTIITISIVIGLILLSGCVTSNERIIPEKHIISMWSDYDDYLSISKISIPEDNVTCYISYTSYGNGISCLKND